MDGLSWLSANRHLSKIPVSFRVLTPCQRSLYSTKHKYLPLTSEFTRQANSEEWPQMKVLFSIVYIHLDNSRKLALTNGHSFVLGFGVKWLVGRWRGGKTLLTSFQVALQSSWLRFCHLVEMGITQFFSFFVAIFLSLLHIPEFCAQ